jgi:hypothetical protein
MPHKAKYESDKGVDKRKRKAVYLGMKTTVIKQHENV